MYTLESLQQKNLKELKEIGWQLNVFPDGDRRCRQNWIDALVGVQPPLLQLLEVSPAEVEPVEEAIDSRPTQKVQKHKFLLCLKEGGNTLWYDGKDFVFEKWSAKTYCKRGVASAKYQLRFHPEVKRAGILQVVENSADQEPIEVQAQEPVVGTARTQSNTGLQGFRVQAQEPPIESKFGRIVYFRAQKQNGNQTNKTNPDRAGATSAGLHNSRIDTTESDASGNSFEGELDKRQIRGQFLAIPGDSERDKGSALLHQPIELAAIFSDEQPPNRGEGKGRLENEPKLSQSAIDPAAKKSLDVGADCSQSLPGITFSPRFLATYPPYFGEVRFKAEATGQLNLLESAETEDEPPDPDDFELLEDFKKAIARWDSDHNEPSSEHNEPLEVLLTSLDSMCEWAPCPDDWYEPDTLLEPSEVLELSPAILFEGCANESSSTSANFYIPTFDAWCDRRNDTDEPPDTGIFARLPGPKPPSFPPGAIDQTHTKRIPNSTQTHTYCIAAGSSSQSGRSPPGGDAM